MPTNLLINYNNLLELIYRTHRDNLASLRGVYDKDFNNYTNLFRGLPVLPTPDEGADEMDRQFWHLTTVITNKATKKREFENGRAVRIHWIKIHLEEKTNCDMLFFKVENEKRVYILNKTERYIVILEPRRDAQSYYLLSAYPLHKSGYKSIMDKYERRGERI